MFYNKQKHLYEQHLLLILLHFVKVKPTYIMIVIRCLMIMKVTTEEGKALATQLGCPFFETSAALRHFVDDAFHALIREIRRLERQRQVIILPFLNYVRSWYSGTPTVFHLTGSYDEVVNWDRRRCSVAC